LLPPQIHPFSERAGRRAQRIESSNNKVHIKNAEKGQAQAVLRWGRMIRSGGLIAERLHATKDRLAERVRSFSFPVTRKRLGAPGQLFGAVSRSIRPSCSTMHWIICVVLPRSVLPASVASKSPVLRWSILQSRSLPSVKMPPSCGSVRHDAVLGVKSRHWRRRLPCCVVRLSPAIRPDKRSG
jgi:hypothetical protein